MKHSIIILTAAALTLSACGTDECAKAENPAECRQWVDAGGDINDYLIGGMAGYLIGSQMSGGQRHSYIYRDPGYRGAYRPMRAPIGSRDQQVRKMERKIQAQKIELKRQQAANARKSKELRAIKAKQRSSSYSYKPSRPSYSRPSYRSKK